MVLGEILSNPTIQKILPLLYFTLGMVVYGIFVFKFYRYLARMDIFDLNLRQYNYAEHPFFQKLFATLLYIAEFFIIFPILIFFWFSVIVVLLAFLSQMPLSNIALLSMALVGAIRITAYYSEDLSRDLAKMIPFALLGVFLVDITIFSLESSLTRLAEAPNILELVVIYLAFVMIVETAMRLTHWLRGSPDVGQSA